MLNEIVSLMSYKKMLKGEYVFEFGDVGDNFYLILDGIVEIQIPDSNEQGLYESTRNEIIVKQSRLDLIFS